jgi:hypothetical protein
MKNDRIKNDRIKSDRIKSGRIKSDRIKTDRIKRITDTTFICPFSLFCFFKLTSVAKPHYFYASPSPGKKILMMRLRLH